MSSTIVYSSYCPDFCSAWDLCSDYTKRQIEQDAKECQRFLDQFGEGL